MTHAYPRGLRGPAAQDAALVIAAVAFVLLPDVPAGVRGLMLGAIAIVLAWGAVTLHFPSRVEIDPEGVTFARSRRAHRFGWKDVRGVKVRRFLVKDRVLVRIDPAGGAWRGRYWILDSIEGFEGLVQELERRGREGS